MGRLDGKVAIVTGAGRGIGRDEVLLLAQEGASVVINDFDTDVAEQTAAEISAAGGKAVASQGDVSNVSYGEALVKAALDNFGELHILVNNAGFTRDSMFVNMTESEWDQVMSVHLKGLYAPTKAATAYWRARSKDPEREPLSACIINTSSGTGLFGNVGQVNYAAAKGGIAIATLVLANELSRYGVRVNAIAPNARTRLTEQTPGLDNLVKVPEGEGKFDVWAPANVAPLVTYLASDQCKVTGGVFFQIGCKVGLCKGWTVEAMIGHDAQALALSDLDELMPELFEGIDISKPVSQGNLMQDLVLRAVRDANAAPVS